MKKYIFSCIVLGVLLGGMGCKKAVTYRYTEGKIYGTFFHISYASQEDLGQVVRQEMEKVNESLSMFNSCSVIARLNRSESDSTDMLFRRMFDQAEKVNRATEGAFDITIAPLVNAWGFGVENFTFPDSARIDSLLPLVGMEKLEVVDGKLLKACPGMQLDASSIAKGLGVDVVAEFFDCKGIEDYMVEIGGEVRVKGKSSKGRAWRIGIDRPEEGNVVSDRPLQAIVEITAGALATSGNYRNFYVHEGKKYAHTINPKTGFPVQTEVLGASVYARECMEADAYATAFMVLGLKKSQAIIERTPGMEGYLIYEEEGKLKTWMSEGMKKLMEGAD